MWALKLKAEKGKFRFIADVEGLCVIPIFMDKQDAQEYKTNHVAVGFKKYWEIVEVEIKPCGH